MDYLSSTFFLDNTIENWLISVFFVLGFLLIARVFSWISKRIILKIAKKTNTRLDDLLLNKIGSPIALAIILGGIWFAIIRLHFNPKFDEILTDVYKISVILNVTWIFSRITNSLIKEFLVPYSEKKETVDDHVIKVLQKTINVIIWIFGIVVALGNVGINIAAIITGLGIGGIAFALAAQDTIKNIFAGIIIFIDRPFRLGDRIKLDHFDGFVEDIGLRSVRIRTLDKRLLTISSSKVIDSVVENVTVEPAHQVVLSLNLTYCTTPEQMTQALELLKQLPSSVPEIEKDVAAFFSGYGDSSLNIKLFYNIRKEMDISEVESKMNLIILSLFNKNGLKFAYPTSTVYLEK
jgi:MscS family membrane protein